VSLQTTSWSNYNTVVRLLGRKIQSFWSKYDPITAHFGEKRPYTAFLRKYGPLYKLGLGPKGPNLTGPEPRQTCPTIHRAPCRG